MRGDVLTSRTRTPPWVLPLLLLVGLLATSRAAGAGWLEDDRGWVREDAAVLSGVDGVGEILADGRPQPTSLGRPERPLARITLALERSLQGLGEPAARAHHLGSMAWHLLAVALLFFVLRAQFARGAVAAVGAGLFAMHPLAAPAVTALGERGQLVALVLVLAATLCWQRTARDGPAWWGPALLLSFLAPFAHETALAWPLVLLAWGPPEGAPRPRTAGRLATLLFLLPVAAVLFIGPVGPAAPAGLPAVRPADAAVLAVVGIGRTLLNFVLPVNLSDDARAAAVLAGGFEPTVVAHLLAGLVALLTIGLVLCAVLHRSGRGDALLTAFLLLGVGHALLQPLAAGLEVRAAYGLLPPLVTIAAFIVVRAARGVPTLSAAARAALLLTAVVGSGALIWLARDASAGFSDEVARLDRRLARYPDDVLALEALSAYHRREAAVLRRAAAELPANDEQRGVRLLAARQHVAAALAAARQATEHPVGYRRSESWAALGLAMLADGRPPDARPWLERATQLDISLRDAEGLEASAGSPRALEQAELFHALGQAYVTTAAPDLAIEPYIFAAKLAPDNVSYLQRAGLALDAAGRFAEGLVYLERALAKAPRSQKAELLELIERERSTAKRRVDDLLAEGSDALGRGDFIEARRAYEAALSLDPDRIEALVEGGYLGGWHFGRYEEGLERLERAARLLREAGLDEDDPARTRVATRRDDLIRRREKDDAQLRDEAREDRR